MIKSNSKNNTSETSIEEKKNNNKVGLTKCDVKSNKIKRQSTKQNSKILIKDKVSKAKTIEFKNKVDSNKENQQAVFQKTGKDVNTKSKKKFEENKLKFKTQTNFQKKIQSTKNLKEENKINSTTEEVVTTLPTLTTNICNRKNSNLYMRQVSSGSIKERLLTPTTLSPNRQLIIKSKSNGKFNLTTSKKENKIYKYTEQIIKELEESKIREENYIDTIEYNEKKLDFTGIDNDEESKEEYDSYNTETNLNTLYKTANLRTTLKKESNEKNTSCAVNLVNNTNSKRISKKNTFSINTTKVNNNRPKSEYKKENDSNKPQLLRIMNKTIVNLNNTININTGNINKHKDRPKTSYKKADIELKLNEASLSTEASIFRGRAEDYAIGKEVGKGAYAIVKQAHHKPSNRKMAIKIYEKVKLLDIQRKNSVKREIQILKKIDHFNIVKLYEIIDNPKQILLVMELVNGVSLLAFLKAKQNRRLEENECKYIFQQIVRAIAHCHSKNICHRDIKLENIIVDESKNIKLIDFGFGTVALNSKLLNFFCGTPSYMSPEIVQKRDYIGQYADIWSLGILLYTLLCGAFPFRALSEKELYGKIIKGVYNFPEHLSSRVCDLIRRILNLTPDLRPTAEEILQDVWFSNNHMSFEETLLNTSLSPSATLPKLMSEI